MPDIVGYSLRIDTRPAESDLRSFEQGKLNDLKKKVEQQLALKFRIDDQALRDAERKLNQAAGNIRVKVDLNDAARQLEKLFSARTIKVNLDLSDAQRQLGGLGVGSSRASGGLGGSLFPFAAGAASTGSRSFASPNVSVHVPPIQIPPITVQGAAPGGNIGAWVMQGAACPQCGAIGRPGQPFCTSCGYDNRGFWQRGGVRRFLSGTAGVAGTGASMGWAAANAGWGLSSLIGRATLGVAGGLYRFANWMGGGHNTQWHPNRRPASLNDVVDAIHASKQVSVNMDIESLAAKIASARGNAGGGGSEAAGGPSVVTPPPGMPVASLPYGEATASPSSHFDALNAQTEALSALIARQTAALTRIASRQAKTLNRINRTLKKFGKGGGGGGSEAGEALRTGTDDSILRPDFTGPAAFKVVGTATPLSEDEQRAFDEMNGVFRHGRPPGDPRLYSGGKPPWGGSANYNPEYPIETASGFYADPAAAQEHFGRGVHDPAAMRDFYRGKASGYSRPPSRFSQLRQSINQGWGKVGAYSFAIAAVNQLTNQVGGMASADLNAIATGQQTWENAHAFMESELGPLNSIDKAAGYFGVGRHAQWANMMAEGRRQDMKTGRMQQAVGIRQQLEQQGYGLQAQSFELQRQFNADNYSGLTGQATDARIAAINAKYAAITPPDRETARRMEAAKAAEIAAVQQSSAADIKTFAFGQSQAAFGRATEMGAMHLYVAGKGDETARYTALRGAQAEHAEALFRGDSGAASDALSKQKAINAYFDKQKDEIRESLSLQADIVDLAAKGRDYDSKLVEIEKGRVEALRQVSDPRQIASINRAAAAQRQMAQNQQTIELSGIYGQQWGIYGAVRGNPMEAARGRYANDLAALNAQHPDQSNPIYRAKRQLLDMGLQQSGFDFQMSRFGLAQQTFGMLSQAKQVDYAASGKVLSAEVEGIMSGAKQQIAGINVQYRGNEYSKDRAAALAAVRKLTQSQLSAIDKRLAFGANAEEVSSGLRFGDLNNKTLSDLPEVRKRIKGAGGELEEAEKGSTLPSTERLDRIIEKLEKVVDAINGV